MKCVISGAFAIVALGIIASPGFAQTPKLQVGLPAIPPVFATVLQFSAQDAGIYKKYGVEPTLRPFDSGAAAARAVQSGNIEVSLSPTPVIINMVANANVDMVMIWGMENPTWVLATTDAAIKKCADVKGQAIGVDSINGARSVAMREMIAPCGLKSADVQEVALSSNVGAAMIAGQLKVGVLHMDDVPVIEEQMKRPLARVTTMKEVNPVNHYLALVALRETLAKNRDAFVRLLAAQIETARYLRDPANADKVAQFAAPTGRSPSVAKAALASYNAMEFWPVDKDGLSRKNLDAVVEIQKTTGGIKEPDKAPGYEKLTDTSVWQDAMKLVHAKK